MPRSTRRWTAIAALILLATALGAGGTRAQELTYRFEGAEAPARAAVAGPAPGAPGAPANPVLPAPPGTATPPLAFQEEFVEPDIGEMTGVGIRAGGATAFAFGLGLVAIGVAGGGVGAQDYGAAVVVIGLGFVAAATIAPPVAVHVANGRRGNLAATIPASVGTGLAGLAVGGLLFPPLGLVAAVVGSSMVAARIEANTTPRPEALTDPAPEPLPESP